MRPTVIWPSAKPGLSNVLHLVCLATLVLAPIVISELLYLALN